MKTLISKLLPTDFFIHPRHLAVYRILYCLIYLWLIGLRSFAWLDSELSYLYDPPRFSVAGMMEGFPSRIFFIVLMVLNMFSFFSMFIGFKTRLSSVLFALTSILGNSFVFSFGKIDHTLLATIAPLFLSFAYWGEYYSVDAMRRGHSFEPNEKHRQRVSFILAMFALTVGFAMLTAALPKIAGGWARWDAEATRYQLFRNYYNGGRTQFLATFVVEQTNHVFWKLLDYGTLIFEAGFLIAALRLKLFRIFIVAAVTFHFLVLMIFNIPFAANLIAYLAFVNWDALEQGLKQRTRLIPFLTKPFVRHTVLALSSVIFVYWVFLLFTNHSLTIFPGVIMFFMDLASVVGSDYKSEYLVIFLSIPALIFILLFSAKSTSRRKVAANSTGTMAEVS